MSRPRRRALGDDELVDDFCRALEGLGRSPMTIVAYRLRLTDFLAHQRQYRRPLVETTREDVEGYHDALRRRRMRRNSIYGFLSTLRAFFAHLVRRRLVPTPPAIELPRLRKNPPTHVLTPRQVMRILAQPDVREPLGLRDRAVLELLYSTGLRQGELRALSVHAIDFGGGFVRVVRGKGGKGRVVPIGEVAMQWVRRYLEEVRPGLVTAPREAVLFVSAHGRPLCPVTMTRVIVRRYVEDAGIPFHATPHAFRHAAATHLLRGDGRDRRAGLLQVRDILGHASTQTTRIYTRVDITDLAHQVAARHFRDR